MMNCGLRCATMLLMALAYLAMADATVLYDRRPLADSIASADLVARVRISRVQERHFANGGRLGYCGTDYFVDVVQTFKGEHLSKRSFSVVGQPHAVIFHEVQVGDELLVLLVARKRYEPPEGGALDEIRGAPSRAELDCRSKLSGTTLLAGEGGGFPLIKKPEISTREKAYSVWVAYARSRTDMPESLRAKQILYDDNCEAEKCDRDGRRMIPWELLKVEIQRSVDIM